MLHFLMLNIVCVITGSTVTTGVIPTDEYGQTELHKGITMVTMVIMLNSFNDDNNGVPAEILLCSCWWCTTFDFLFRTRSS